MTSQGLSGYLSLRTLFITTWATATCPMKGWSRASWYVFSALGFYPAVPGSTDYSLGTPRVKTGSIKLENGNIFKIKTSNLSDVNYYVQSVELNGMDLNRSFITHEEIMKGGSFLCNASYCASYRISSRMATSMDSSSEHLGLRTVATVEMVRNMNNN